MNILTLLITITLLHKALPKQVEQPFGKKEKREARFVKSPDFPCFCFISYSSNYHHDT